MSRVNKHTPKAVKIRIKNKINIIVIDAYNNNNCAVDASRDSRTQVEVKIFTGLKLLI